MADFKTIQEQNIEQAQQFANALYNVQLGTDTLDQVLLEANQLASMRAAFDRYYFYSYGSTPVADVASMMVENFGIVEGDFGLTAADVLLLKLMLLQLSMLRLLRLVVLLPRTSSTHSPL